MSDAEPVAVVRGLRVEVGGRAIVDGVDLTLRAGRITALVGPSGSGKTTTALALLGEYPPGARVTGEVRVVGGGAVGYVPQHPGAVLNPVRRVGVLLRDIARARAGDRRSHREAVHEALRAARIEHPEQVVRRFPHQLSGGQQQRVVVAQALLLGARVVVADEPTTGQDALTRQGVVERLAALAGEGIAVLLLSHDLDVVRRLADEVVLLANGRPVGFGPPARVLPAPEPVEVRPARAGADDGPDADAATEVRLEVRDLTAGYPTGVRREATVLDRLSLTVAPGECLALVGRSGSGKTTLGRCLAGLHSGYRGRIRFDGMPLPRSLRGRTTGQLAAVQYVFQDARASFDEGRPVVDQVARTAVRLRGVYPDAARTQALDTLADLGLAAPVAERRPGALSGGELQRAALARALLARPGVLVCDEITSGLDGAARAELLDLLARSRERIGLSLVLITHDLTAAARLADRIAVLDAGRLVEQGPAGRILTDPRHMFTRSLVRAAGEAVSRGRGGDLDDPDGTDLLGPPRIGREPSDGDRVEPVPGRASEPRGPIGG
ncbi:ABC transporter ATP-binding protein [Embleya hyalina]|uniref:ABC transporter ATP-binding protein n=1 Tax=Embleya hyalina TaxID=516124 RepID=A0A401YPS7_9ACTN|nr:ATP-binding cassette domain-containing protein [Embleya hyalina]GCD96597.1 ABC transporter ATP-binding protein [Embleya hyalina]